MFLFQQSDYAVNYSDLYTEVFLKIRRGFCCDFFKRKISIVEQMWCFSITTRRGRYITGLHNSTVMYTLYPFICDTD